MAYRKKHQQAENVVSILQFADLYKQNKRED